MRSDIARHPSDRLNAGLSRRGILEGVPYEFQGFHVVRSQQSKIINKPAFQPSLGPLLYAG
jgi:type IV secretory pathway VirB3-like protein